MVHAIRPVFRPHPDANRIAGLSVAIAANAALLMLLLVPLQAPPTLPKDIVVRPWFLPPDKTPPPPQPPVQAEVTKAQPATTPTKALPQPQPPQVDQVVVDGGSEPAIPAGAVEPTAASIEPPSQPLPGVRLEYARAPAPAYPRDALREGATGTVLLQVLVDVDGRPLDVQVSRSSGNRSLDRAAREQVLKHWRFRPAMQDGRAVQAIGLVPIAFNLD